MNTTSQNLSCRYVVMTSRPSPAPVPTSAGPTCINGFSYATDLFYQINLVKDQFVQDSAIMKNISELIRGRIQLEEKYAHDLVRLVDTVESSTLACLEKSTPGQYSNFVEKSDPSAQLQDMAFQLMAQYRNASVQHQSLIESLAVDILHPLNEFLQQKRNQVKTMAEVEKRNARSGRVRHFSIHEGSYYLRI